MCSGARNRGLTWEAAAEHARSLGALLPTRDDLKRAKASGEITASLPGRDIWLPVRRADGIEGDWCAPNNEAIGSYNSHLDRHRQIPGWGSDGGGHKHIPGTHGAQLPFFFLVKQPPGYSGGKMTAAALGNGGYVDRAKLLALSPGGEPLTASAAECGGDSLQAKHGWRPCCSSLAPGCVRGALPCAPFAHCACRVIAVPRLMLCPRRHRASTV